MKLLSSTILMALISSSALAADFTVSFTPADSSVSNQQVSTITTSKISDFISAIAALANRVISNDNAGTTVINTSQLFVASGVVPTTIDTVNCNASVGAVVLTMPDATLNKSKRFFLKKVDSTANLCTFPSVSSQTFMAGITVMKMGRQGDNVAVVSDGANWQVENFNIATAINYGLSVQTAFNGGSPIKYDTKLNDPLSQYSAATGIASIYYPGTYRLTQAINNTVTGCGTSYYRKNSAPAQNLTYCNAPGQMFNASASASIVANDTLFFSAEGTTTYYANNGNGYFNYMVIERTGN